MMTLFEKATRYNYTYKTEKGILSVGQLWKLHLTSTKGPSLQSVAIDIHKEIQASGEELFVSSARPNKEVRLLKDKLEVVKRIIEIREAENAETLAAKKKAVMKDQLLKQLEQREQEDLQKLTKEEIEARLKEL